MKENIVARMAKLLACCRYTNLTPARRKFKKVVLDALLLEHSDG
jgi:hypothetical protein